MEITITKRAVIYCRVSTKEQVEEGNSLVTQEKVCKEYALKNGYDIVETFIEQGESAKTTARTELKRLMSFCKERKNKINAVITYKLDRISRNTDDYSQIRIELKLYGVEIKSTSEYFEDSPSGRFMENMIATVAQFDNDVRTERSVGGMRDAMREGRYVWIAPIGYNNAKLGGKSTIVQNTKAPIVRKTFEEIAKNMAPADEIRKQMANKGLVGKKGKLIAKSYFYRMLKNEVYCGWIIKFGEHHKGLFEPIITQELFDQVQRVLKYRKHKTLQYLRENPDFPLRRFVMHPDGLKLRGGWSTGRSKKYAYYFFAGKQMVFKKDSLNDGFVEFLTQFKLTDAQYNTLKVKAYENLNVTQEDKRKQAIRIDHYITELKEKQSALIQKNLQGVISDAILRQQLEQVDTELMNSYATRQSIPDRRSNIEAMLNEVKEYFLNPGKVWLNSPFIIKLKLQRFTFPKSVLFDGTKFRTAEVCNIFKAKRDFLAHEFSGVPLTSKSENHPKVATEEKCWEAFEEKIDELAEILETDNSTIQ